MADRRDEHRARAADRRGREARTSSTPGRCRTRSTRSRSRAPRAATSGTTTASATSTSRRSSSTSRSATSTRRLVAAIKEQADKLCTIGPPMATEPRSTLARLIAEVTPGDLSMSFFTNGGAEANENAIKLARWYTGRHKVDRALPPLPRRDGRRDHAHRRPAPLGRRAGHPGRRAHVRPVHVPLPRRPSRSVPGLHGRAAPRGDPPVRGRRTPSPR